MEVFNINYNKLVFFLFVFFLTCSVVCAEDVTNGTLNYEYPNEESIASASTTNDNELLSEVDNSYSDDYYTGETDLEYFDDDSCDDNDYDEDLFSNYNQGWSDELLDKDIGVVYFDEDVVNYSLIDENSKYISSRSGNSTVSFSVDDIGRAAKSLLTYINANQRLSGTVNVSNVRVNMNDFLYLMCKSLNTTDNITFINFNHVSSISGTNRPGLYLSKNVCKSIAASIVDCYELNGRNPLNLNYNNITINFEDTVYLYTRIVRYKYVHGNFASTAAIKAMCNHDYSTETPALATNTSQAFKITANSVDNEDGTYSLTLTPSQSAVIYYTRNGTMPTTESKVYNGTLTIYSNTWVRYFGVNNNGQTPVLSYGVYRASLPYITRNPVLHSNGYNYGIYLHTSQASTIYYTTNGTIPTTQSKIYNGSITVNNYTLLQYFAVTTSNNQQSNIFYYRLDNPTPYVTILNTTDVRDNHQNITIIANKPGTIYYTRNGSTPTTNSNVYTSGRIMELSIPTQLRAILVDTNNQTSQIVFYQAPQIITPPITIIKPVTGLLPNNNQQIQFIANKPNATIYYTIDGSNPFTSNTTSIAHNATTITIHKTTYLKYYTRDSPGYTSTEYLYRTPRHADERPEITIYNTTGIYSDGTQRIMIQSNQPGQFNITIYNGTNTPTELKNKHEELTISKDNKIQIYTQYNGKYSKTIEYNPINGTQTVMNYNYTIQLPNIDQYSEIYFSTDEIYNYSINSNDLNNYIHINLINNQVNVKNSGYMNQPGVTIHKSNNSIEITYYSQMYGETNIVNVIFSTLQLNNENIRVYSNGTQLFKVYWKKNNNNPEIISTHFETLSNKFSKNETITYTPKFFEGMCGNYDIIQTYLLTNEKITSEFYNQSLYDISNYYLYEDVSGISPQYRTIITGLTTLWAYDGYADYMAYQLNSTVIRSDETLCIVGINYDRVNYVQYNDLKMGMILQGNNTNEYFFNLHTSTALPEIARITLNLIRPNLAKTAQTLLMQLSNTTTTYVYTNNQTMVMRIYSPDLLNVYLMMEAYSGIVSSIIIVDGFEYNGAITDPLIPEYENNSTRLIDDLLNSSKGFCFEDNCYDDNLENSYTLFGWSTDSGWSILEGTAGSLLLTYGLGILFATATVACPPAVIGAILLGGFLLFDSHGVLTGTATHEDLIELCVDAAMLPIGSLVSRTVYTIAKNSLLSIPRGIILEQGITEAIHEYRLLNSIQTISRTCIETARDEIIAVPVQKQSPK